MKKADVWGQCPRRKLQYCGRHGWRYICENTRGYCHPNYCLGPDGDRDDVEVAHEEVNAG